MAASSPPRPAINYKIVRHFSILSGAQQLRVSQNTGVVVLQVVAGSPAATAALQPGDVITAFNGQNTSTAEEFIAKLRPVKPGDQITLTVLRAGATQQIKVTAADRPK